MFDWLIVGAGFAGSVLAERLANETDARILIIDRRLHVGGNTYDRFDKSGVLVPSYGRHVLQTTDERVLGYLSRFADWLPYEPAGEQKRQDVSRFADRDGEPLVPAKGYANLFERMLESPNIKIMLNVDYAEVQSVIPFRRVIYTGSLDEYFDHCYGKLPYWSADFSQAAPHHSLADDVIGGDIILGRPENEGGYPLAEESSRALFRRYKDLADAAVNVFFTGRLPTYRYCTMDEVVAQSLALFDRIGGERAEHGMLPDVAPKKRERRDGGVAAGGFSAATLLPAVSA
ncbi:MAG: UDP-galactopyranose mutase [Rhodospirillales bacterium]